MKKAFEGFNEDLIVASVSPWLMERAKVSPILSGIKHVVALNGLDTSVFHVYDSERIIKKHSLEGKKVIFHATPGFSLDPNHIKGGYYLNEVAKCFVGEDVIFVVAGDYDKNANYSNNIVFLGKINDQKELAQYYSAADLTLLTSRKETFSMVTAESLCCGTPVVGFKAGAPEMIALPDFSEFVEWPNVEKLEQSIRNMIEHSADQYEIESKAHAKYSIEIMFNTYEKLYGQLL